MMMKFFLFLLVQCNDNLSHSRFIVIVARLHTVSWQSDMPFFYSTCATYYSPLVVICWKHDSKPHKTDGASWKEKTKSVLFYYNIWCAHAHTAESMWEGLLSSSYIIIKFLFLPLHSPSFILFFFILLPRASSSDIITKWSANWCSLSFAVQSTCVSIISI